MEIEEHDVVVIGAGQAGLAVGHQLQAAGVDFVIVDAHARVGDAWRSRWDSLRLFTPAPFDELPGHPFPDRRYRFPTKDEMADYLESCAVSMPLRLDTRVRRLSHDGARFALSTTSGPLRARRVVIAMSGYQRPHVPAYADQLAPDILQLHSAAYRSPAQLQAGPVLVVGAGNSGAEIGRELARHLPVTLAGRSVGEMPFRVEGFWGRAGLTALVLRVLFHHVLSVATPVGRAARPTILSQGGPLIRVRERDLRRLGVRRVGRVEGVHQGRPQLAGGAMLDAANVIWCTGFRPGLDWVELPIFDERGLPRHRRGVTVDVPGLYFVGLPFQFSLSSTMIHGVGRDAARIVRHLVAAERTAA